MDSRALTFYDIIPILAFQHNIGNEIWLPICVPGQFPAFGGNGAQNNSFVDMKRERWGEEQNVLNMKLTR